MSSSKLFLLSAMFLGAACLATAQPTDIYNKPSVTLENNRPKPSKDSPYRTIVGTVKDSSDNPLSGAIVQLKNLKTSKIVNFSTKDDGKFTFRDLALDNNFELIAKRGNLVSTVRKVSIFDTRKEVIINFKLEPPEKQ